MNSIKIREIQPEDNQDIAEVIKEVLIEMGAPKVGTAYEDKSLDELHASYTDSKSIYFVVENNKKVIGGAGIAPLEGQDGKVCELQKMYVLQEARGKGVGALLMDKCLDFARSKTFEQCYIETLPYMQNAQKLYRKSGFVNLEKPLGDTGHYSCTVWMLKDL